MAAEKEDSLIVGPEKGSINFEPDPKLKWYARAVTGAPQQFGLGVMFVLALITFWYFRTYGWAGVIKNPGGMSRMIGSWSGSSSSHQRAQPVIITHDWSATIYRDTTKSTRFTSDPLTAIMEVRNPNNPKRVVRWDDNGHIPPEWSQLQFRLADDEQLTSAKLTIR